MVRTVYDPCCGSGGMLTIAKDHIAGHARQRHVHRRSTPTPTSISSARRSTRRPSPSASPTCIMKSRRRPRRREHPLWQHALRRPPRRAALRLPDRQSALRQGLEAGRRRRCKAEHERGAPGRFGAGPAAHQRRPAALPAAHARPHAGSRRQGGSRVAIIMNGSPLFTGDAGSGESEIRRWILENDWLEAIVALPEQLFYNTGIATYVWVLTNRKAPERAGQGAADRRHRRSGCRCARAWATSGARFPRERADEILALLRRLRGRGACQDLPDDPLRLPQDHRRAPAAPQLPGLARSASPGWRRRRAFQNLARSRKKNKPRPKRLEEAAGRAQQDSIRDAAGRAAGYALYQTAQAFVQAARQAGRRQAGLQAQRAAQEGDPQRSRRAGRDGRDLPRQEGQPRARHQPARHGERAAGRGHRGLLRARGAAPRARRLDRRRASATTRTARWATSATRSTSTATSTSTRRPARWRRSRRTFEAIETEIMRHAGGGDGKQSR